MDANRKAPRFRTTLFITVLLTFALGCLCLPTSVIPTGTPAEPPTDTPALNLPPTPTPLPPLPPPTLPPVTQPPVDNGGGLDPQGPWLLIESTSAGLWAVNQDGSGLTMLTDFDYWNGNIQDAVQPNGREIAFISPANFDFHHMALNLLSVPDGKVTKVTDLTSTQTEAYADSAPGDPGFEALRAVGEQRSFAWSPDGARLAFIGIMDGPSADVYLLDEPSNEIRRLSQDEAQDFSPSWSPDGSHLIWLAAEGFGTGAGFSMSGVWAAAGDGSNAGLLYPATTSGEEIDGWLDDTTALLASWSPICGPNKLRLYDVVSRQQTILNQDCFGRASAEGLHGEALFSNDSGLYLLTSEDRTPVKVSDRQVAYIKRWGPFDYTFIVRFAGGQVATFGSGTYDTQFSPSTMASASTLPYDDQDVSMYGAIWGWTSQNPADPGVWITGPGIDIGRIFDGPARLPAWGPHNDLLFFALADSGGYDLYLDTFDSHYTDLHQVNHFDGDINSIIWHGQYSPY
jgi:hypothetical protein